MKKYKWITIEALIKDEYHIFNNKTNDVLGEIKFYKKWNCWVVNFFEDAVFSASCLEDIAKFIRGLG